MPAAAPLHSPRKSYQARLWRRMVRVVQGTSHDMSLEPLHDVCASGNGYDVSGPNPELRVLSERTALPHGWVAASYRWQGGGDPPGRLILFAEAGGAQPEAHLLPARDTTSTPVLLRLPAQVHGLRLRPPETSRFELGALQIRELSAAQIAREQLRPYGNVMLREPGMAWHFLRRGVEVLLHHGWHELRTALTMRVAQRPGTLYGKWVRRYDTPGAREETAVRRQLAQLRVRPTFTLIVSIDGGSSSEPAPAVRSVRDQWYPDWELLLVATPRSSDADRKAIRQLSDEDTRVRLIDCTGAQWSTAVNQALAQATGTFCAVIAADAQLAPHGLYTAAVELSEHPDAAAIFGDEDHIDGGGQRHTPLFKPDWNPDLLCSQPRVGDLILYRTNLLRRIGGWRTGMDGLEDWDLALRASTAVPAEQMRHVPHVLHHHHAATGRVPHALVPSEPARRILREHLNRAGVTAQVSEDGEGSVRIRYGLPAPPPLVSIIVPTRNCKDLLQRCVTTVAGKTDYTNWELLIVDNQSDDPATVTYLSELQLVPNVRVLRFDQPFNFSALNNFAVAQARGSLLAFLNNDVEVITPDWLAEMVGHALRPEVGAVGAKLYYPDGRLQHAGILLGLGKLAGHPYRGLMEPEPAPNVRTRCVQNLSAVTGACLVMRTEVFQVVGGLDEDLPLAYNDVDLCLRLRQRGYRIVWTPYAQLYHWESATRGLDHSMRKVRRLRREQAIMVARWGAAFERDPAYNPNLTLSAPGFALAFPPRVRRPWSPPVRSAS